MEEVMGADDDIARGKRYRRSWDFSAKHMRDALDEVHDAIWGLPEFAVDDLVTLLEPYGLTVVPKARK